jgi:hypothetical protein
VVLVAIVVLVGSCAVTLGPVIGTDVKLTQDLGTRAESVSFGWVNGDTSFTITLAAGQESDVTYIVCQIIRPDIRSSSTPNAHFVVYGSSATYGKRWLADDSTSCP